MKQFIKEKPWVIAGIIALILHFILFGGDYLFRVTNLIDRPWIYFRNVFQAIVGSILWFLIVASITYGAIKRQWTYWIVFTLATLGITLPIGLVLTLFGYSTEVWGAFFILLVFPSICVDYFLAVITGQAFWWERDSVLTVWSFLYITLSALWVYAEFFKNVLSLHTRKALLVVLLLILLIGMVGCEVIDFTF